MFAGLAGTEQRVQPEVRYLQHPPAVHEAVAGLEVAVGDDAAVVYKRHTLRGRKIILLIFGVEIP